MAYSKSVDEQIQAAIAKINKKIEQFNLLVPIIRLQRRVFIVEEEVQKL